MTVLVTLGIMKVIKDARSVIILVRIVQDLLQTVLLVKLL